MSTTDEDATICRRTQVREKKQKTSVPLPSPSREKKRIAHPGWRCPSAYRGSIESRKGSVSPPFCISNFPFNYILNVTLYRNTDGPQYYKTHKPWPPLLWRRRAVVNSKTLCCCRCETKQSNVVVKCIISFLNTVILRLRPPLT